MNRPIYGNPATTPNPVADFNQNNPKKADYIKNRPFYEIIEPLEVLQCEIVGPDWMVIKFDISKQIIGKKIILELTINDKTHMLVIDSLVKYSYTEFGNGITCYYRKNSYENNIDVYTDEVVMRTVAAKVYYVTGIKELDEKFIPDRIKYTYVTDKKLGEAVPMIGDTTTFIGLDEELNTGDMIMVKGYFNDGTSESYVVEVGEIGGDYGGRIDADVGRLDNVHVPISTAVTFQSEIKGEVYKLNKKPIYEATTELYGIVKEIDEALDRVIEKYGLDDTGFVMPEDAFAIEQQMNIPAGTYEFVAFIAEDGTVYEEIPENGMIGGAMGSDIDNSSSCFIYPNTKLIIENDGIKLFGYTSLMSENSSDYINGTTYIVRVGDA